jgi:hypothetical protein
MTDAAADVAAGARRDARRGPDGVLRWIDTLSGWQLGAAVLLAPVVGGLLISVLIWGMVRLDAPIFGSSRPDFLLARAEAAGGAQPVFRGRMVAEGPAVPALGPAGACEVRLVGPMLLLQGCVEGGPVDGLWPLAGVRWPALGSEAEKRALAALQGLVPAAARLDCVAVDAGMTCRAGGVWLDEALLASGLAFPEAEARARALAWPAMQARRGVWWDGLAMQSAPSAMVAWRSLADASAGMAEATAQAGVGLRTAFMMAVTSGVLTGLGVLLGLRHQRSEAQQKQEMEARELQARRKRRIGELDSLKLLLEGMAGTMFSDRTVEGKRTVWVNPDFEDQKQQQLNALARKLENPEKAFDRELLDQVDRIRNYINDFSDEMPVIHAVDELAELTALGSVLIENCRKHIDAS